MLPLSFLNCCMDINASHAQKRHVVAPSAAAAYVCTVNKSKSSPIEGPESKGLLTRLIRYFCFSALIDYSLIQSHSQLIYLVYFY